MGRYKWSYISPPIWVITIVILIITPIITSKYQNPPEEYLDPFSLTGLERLPKVEKILPSGVPFCGFYLQLLGKVGWCGLGFKFKAFVA